jgi:hypothetical protein
MLYLAEDQKMINKEEKDELNSMALNISKMIGSLINTSKKNE